MWREKGFAAIVVLSAIFAYGFLVTHHTVGIDDTPSAYYFRDGLSAIVGRWVFFLLNKFFTIWKLAPFITDLAGVLLFVLGASVWAVLLKRIFGQAVPGYGYGIFAALLLTNPLHSEVFTYYLHNGVGMGYLFTGLALCCYEEGCRQRVGHWTAFLKSALCLWVAVGCYESFMSVYLTGVCLLLCSKRMTGEKGRIGWDLLWAVGIGLGTLVLRSLMMVLVVKVFGLESLQDQAVQRSVLELLSWIRQPGVYAELGMVVKRLIVMYGAFAYAYYPIAVYVAAVCFMGIFALWMSIRRKDGWIFLLLLGSFVTSYVLAVVEGKATYYRSAQFLPVVCAWGGFWFLYALEKVGEKIHLGESPKSYQRRNGQKLRVIGLFVGAAVLWNQCSDMNHWFYVDDLKYEEAKEYTNQIYYELDKQYDLSKPIIFTGDFQPSKSIIGDAYVNYGSKTFYQINRITMAIDPHLLEKFYRDYGVWVAQTPSLSVVQWGKNAFGSSEELVRFFALQGHEIRAWEDEEAYIAAETDSVSWPDFPKEGSIRDIGEYIVVHF